MFFFLVVLLLLDESEKINKRIFDGHGWKFKVAFNPYINLQF